MSDAPDRLTPAAPEDLADALAFALRFDGRKRRHDAAEIMARIVAKRLVGLRERSGFVVMKRRPKMARYMYPDQKLGALSISLQKLATKRDMTISNSHHYVPQWYQRNFLPAEGGEFFVLDKSPKLGYMPRRARRPIVRRRQVFTSGAHKLFQYDGLYSVALRGVREDVLERFVFGPLDDKGARANQLFCIWPTSRGIGHHGDYPEVPSVTPAIECTTWSSS